MGVIQGAINQGLVAGAAALKVNEIDENQKMRNKLMEEYTKAGIPTIPAEGVRIPSNVSYTTNNQIAQDRLIQSRTQRDNLNTFLGGKK